MFLTDKSLNKNILEQKLKKLRGINEQSFIISDYDNNNSNINK